MLLPADPLNRFVKLSVNLEADHAWYQDATAPRLAAMAALTSADEPAAVAMDIRAKDRELEWALGGFTSMPAQLRMVAAALLHLYDEPTHDFLDEVDRVRGIFREGHLRRSRHYELMAILILRARNPRQPITGMTVRRLRAIWDGMKHSPHWLLKGTDDYPACALLAGLPASAEEIIRRIEAICQALRRRGQNPGHRLQTAANILALAEAAPETLARRFVCLQVGFRDAGLFMVQDDYDDLAILSLLDHPSERVVGRVLEHRETIRKQLRPEPTRQLSFNLATDTAFHDLVRLDRDLKEIIDVEALLDVHAVIQMRQAVAVATKARVFTMVSNLGIGVAEQVHE